MVIFPPAYTRSQEPTYWEIRTRNETLRKEYKPVG
jgi:hypothetical protein